MRDISVIITNLYGTLLFLDYKTEPYQTLSEDLGLKTPDRQKFARKVAMTEPGDIADFAQKISPGTDIDLEPYRQEIEKELASATVYPETDFVLRRLKRKGYDLVCVSNLAPPYEAPFYTLGLDKYFDEVIFSCDVGMKKPDPKIYKGILERFGIKPEQAIMVGDSIRNDYDGPRSIDMNAVILDRETYSPDRINSLCGIFLYL